MWLALLQKEEFREKSHERVTVNCCTDGERGGQRQLTPNCQKVSKTKW